MDPAVSRRTTTWGLLAAAVLAGLAGAVSPRLWPGLLPAWAGPVLFVFALVLAFAALSYWKLPPWLVVIASALGGGLLGLTS